uniref:RxLR effector candidate protein n=1 Tax=Hyaloperonospora arabidopsidis (strain Emoy2) TaxID=559515 RepID=M4BSM6_HYAAE
MVLLRLLLRLHFNSNVRGCCLINFYRLDNVRLIRTNGSQIRTVFSLLVEESAKTLLH